MKTEAIRVEVEKSNEFQNGNSGGLRLALVYMVL